ncbi:hypothetical protein [Archangium violaceum]|nr:hypothetical protein [Archangium violaceum]
MKQPLSCILEKHGDHILRQLLPEGFLQGMQNVRRSRGSQIAEQ